MPRLTIAQRNKVIHLRNKGYGYMKIAQRMYSKHNVKITKKAVRMLCKKYDDTSSTEDRPRSRKGKLYLPEHDEFINNCMRETPDMSAAVLALKIRDHFQINLSPQAVSAYRRKLGWKLQQTRYCQLIRHANKEKRLQWAQEQLAAGEQFNDVVFTDESRIEISRMSHRSFRKDGEPTPRQPRPKHPLSILIWGGISKRGATEIVMFNGIMKSDFYQTILQDALIPFGNEKYPDGYRLFQDNDPKHVSRSTQQFMQEKNINWMKSPPESPDINPIENLWAELKNYVSRVAKPSTKEQLEDAILTFWRERVTVDKCVRYINHIHKVLPKVVECEGKATGF